MASSSAATVKDYLAEMPAERRREVEIVHGVVSRNLPEGYQEVMAWGMISWSVPLAVYPDTYNKQPLMLAALANQKNYISLYLNTVYAVPEFRALLVGSGRKLKMGKGCINFKRADELPLEVIGDIIRRSDLQSYVRTVKTMSKR